MSVRPSHSAGYVHMRMLRKHRACRSFTVGTGFSRKPLKYQPLVASRQPNDGDFLDQYIQARTARAIGARRIAQRKALWGKVLPLRNGTKFAMQSVRARAYVVTAAIGAYAACLCWVVYPTPTQQRG